MPVRAQANRASREPWPVPPFKETPSPFPLRRRSYFGSITPLSNPSEQEEPPLPSSGLVEGVSMRAEHPHTTHSQCPLSSRLRKPYSDTQVVKCAS